MHGTKSGVQLTRAVDPRRSWQERLFLLRVQWEATSGTVTMEVTLIWFKLFKFHSALPVKTIEKGSRIKAGK